MRVVIKVGTSTLAYENTGLLHIRRMKQLCEVLSDIKNAGHEVILVSSGAIGIPSLEVCTMNVYIVVFCALNLFYFFYLFGIIMV